MTTHALIYILAGHDPAGKQTRECLQYCVERGWTFALIPAGMWREAVRLMQKRQAQVLLIPHRPRDEERRRRQDIIEREVRAAGGELRYCRDNGDHRDEVIGKATDELVRRLLVAGVNSDQIIQVIGASRPTVREMIARVRRRLDQ